MDEVDNIIIHSLRQLGCDFDEEIRSLKQFGPSDVVSSVLTCLRTLDASKGWPKIMPRHMSQKVSLCSEMAKTIKDDYGFKDEIGYHQLLYPSENDTRKLLRFLVDQLPDEPDIPVEDEEAAFLNRSIKAELQAAMQQTWSSTPARRQNYKEIYSLKTSPIRPSYIPGAKSARNAGLEKYIRDHLDFTTQQPARQDVAPSVLEHNLVAFVEEKEKEEEWSKIGAESGLHPLQYKQKKLAGINKRMSEALRASMVAAGKSESARVGSESLQEILSSLESTGRIKGRGKFGHEVAFNRPDKPEDASKNETDEELQERRRKEIEELDNTIFSCRSESEQLAKAISTFTSNIRQIEANALLEDQRKKELEKKYLVLKKTMDLLPDAENNIKLLEGLSNKSSQRLVDLAKEWEKHRVPLIEEYRDLRQQQLNKKDESAKLLEEIKAMKAQMKEMAEEMKQKNEKYNALLDQYRELPKEVNRSIYTRRILDIVKNVKKQKAEIDKILLDMKHLMKEITLVTDTLKRSFAVTDELMFADAKKDDLSKQSYRELVAMDECFKKLIGTIEETGEARNSIMQLEVKIEQMQSKVSTLNMERLEEDYQAMKKENQKLMLSLGD